MFISFLLPLCSLFIVIFQTMKSWVITCTTDNVSFIHCTHFAFVYMFHHCIIFDFLVLTVFMFIFHVKKKLNWQWQRCCCVRFCVVMFWLKIKIQSTNMFDGFFPIIYLMFFRDWKLNYSFLLTHILYRSESKYSRLPA